jgi:hypothetical protein
VGGWQISGMIINKGKPKYSEKESTYGCTHYFVRKNVNPYWY